MPKRETDLDTFVVDTLDFVGEGIWPRYLAYMAEHGYDEAEVEAAVEELNKKAGRS